MFLLVNGNRTADILTAGRSLTALFRCVNCHVPGVDGKPVKSHEVLEIEFWLKEPKISL